MGKKYNFEESIRRLEEITSLMENSECSLDETLKLFEEGVRLSRFCESKLSDVERKLEILKSTEIPDEPVFHDEDLHDEETHAEKKSGGQDKKKKKEKSIETPADDPDDNLLF